MQSSCPATIAAGTCMRDKYNSNQPAQGVSTGWCTQDLRMRICLAAALSNDSAVNTKAQELANIANKLFADAHLVNRLASTNASSTPSLYTHKHPTPLDEALHSTHRAHATQLPVQQ